MSKTASAADGDAVARIASSCLSQDAGHVYVQVRIGARKLERCELAPFPFNLAGHRQAVRSGHWACNGCMHLSRLCSADVQPCCAASEDEVQAKKKLQQIFKDGTGHQVFQT